VVALVTVVVIVAAAGAGAAIALTRSSGHSYRTVTVTRASVAQALEGTGTIEAVSQAAVAFPISGTVQNVDVQLGSRVTTGQTLATLQNGPLVQTMLQQQAQLAQANVTLTKALDAQTSGVSGTATVSASTTVDPTTTAAPQVDAATEASGTGSTHGAGGFTGSGNGNSAVGAISAAQQQLLAAQRAVDTDLGRAQEAEQQALFACGVSGPPPTTTTTTTMPGTTTTTAPGTTTTTTAGTTTTTIPSGTTTTIPSGTTTTTVPSGPPTGPGTTRCVQANESFLAAEEAVAHAEQAVAREETSLAKLLSNAARSTSSSSSHSGSTSLGSGVRSGGTQTHVPTPEEIVADQASVDAAGVAVTAAAESLQQATIASPIDGVVGQMSISPGASVSAGSSSATITVIGSDGYEVATSVTVDDIANIKLGESASVVADGSTTTLPGKIVYIGTADLTSTSATYPVVIGLVHPTANAGLRDGATASTSIAIAHATQNALTVPTSAVQNNNGRHFVDVLTKGKLTAVTVQVGVVGPTRTQITSGLKLGQTVVLADLHAALPSSNIANALTRNNTGGGLLGGGGAVTGGGGGGGRFGRGG
jgi:multidrug efflux pump subunit AcrA (membrane-fusion protein)